MNINPLTTVSIVNTGQGAKTLNLPNSILVLNKTITIKDGGGYAGTSNITLNTITGDLFENGTSNYIINRNYGFATFLALSNKWSVIGTDSTSSDSPNSGSSNIGVSSLSSIVAYGLSSINAGHGLSSLSSIVAYGLSSVSGGQGISSLSSIVAYGLSSVSGGEGISSLSSIVAYGLSTVSGGQGISSLSSIIAYGLSSVNGGDGISSLSSIVAYGLSSIRDGISIRVTTGELRTNNLTTSNNIVTSNLVTSNLGVTTNTTISLYNKVVVSVPNSNISVITVSESGVIGQQSYNVGGIIESLYNNGNLIVGVGFGIIIYSSDASIWKKASRNPLPNIRLTSVTYGNGLWVATAAGLNTRNIIYSQDGSYWVQNPYVFPNPLHTVAYNSNYWIVGGENNSTGTSDGIINNTLYKTSNITTASFTPTTSGGFGNRANLVQWGSNMWVAVGRYFNNANSNHVLYSTDGTNWNNATHSNNNSIFFGGSGQDGTGVAYGNGYWFVSGSNRLYRSENGSNFSNITINILGDDTDYTAYTRAARIYDIKYFSKYNRLYATIFNPDSDDLFLQSLDNGNSWNNNPQSYVGNRIYRSAVGVGDDPVLITKTTSIQNEIINTNTVISCNIDTTTIYSSNIIVGNTLTVDTIFVNTIPFVSLALSSINSGSGLSSLSSIVAYGLSTVSGGEGISSLSSIVAYGLSTVKDSIQNPKNEGVSSLSSIIAYGLSTVLAGGSNTINPGVSSLSSIVAYGLSTVFEGINNPINPGVSSLSSIIAYGLSTVLAGGSNTINPGVSSLSSIVAYGLSSVSGGQGISSLSSIISYGLSSVSGGQGISSLSSIVAYGLSTVAGGHGISSLSSIVGYGLSTLERQPAPGVSSLSSIVAYGLSSVSGGEGISSLSSIVAYGLSTVSGGQGISSLSSIVAYGLSSVYGGEGISSLSSIIGYGLSTAGAGGEGVSSLSSIVAYGLSTIISGAEGISSLSSIVAYGLSTVNLELTTYSNLIRNTFNTSNLYVDSQVGINCNTPSYTLDVNGSIQGKLASNSIGNFSVGALGGPGILDAKCNAPDTYVNSLYKLDSWIFQNLITKPPAPIGLTSTSNKSNISISWTNPLLYSIGLLNTYVPNITTLFVNISNTTNTLRHTIVLSNQANLPMYPFAVQGADFFNFGSFNSNIVNKCNTYYVGQSRTDLTHGTGPYNITVYFSNFNVTPQIPINFVNILNVNLQTVGAPSAPRSLAFIGSNENSITFQWLNPQFSEAADNLNTVALCNYRLIASNVSVLYNIYPRRFRGTHDTRDLNAIPNTINFVGGTQSSPVTGLYPDNPYSGRIEARNVINTDYGLFSNFPGYSITTLPIEPARLQATSLTPNAGYTYAVTGIIASNRNASAVTVYNLENIVGGLIFTFPNLAIHSSSTPGISNVDISRIIASNSSGSTAFFSNAGFLDSNSYSNAAQCNIIIGRNNVRDHYGTTEGYTGFYQVANYTVSFGQSLFSARQEPFRLFVSQSNSNSPNPHFATQTNVFYIDDLAAASSVNMLSNDGVFPLPSNYITGVASYSPGNILSNFIDISNIGKNFLNSANLGQYALTIGANGPVISDTTILNSITTPILNTTNTVYSSGVLPNPARIHVTSILTIGANVAFTSDNADLVMNIVTRNIREPTSGGQNVFNCNVLYFDPTLGRTLKPYIDYRSINVISLGGSNSSNGLRVESGIGLTNPTNYGSNFNHMSNLATTYVNELQMVNGLYVTKAASPVNAYRNYSNYYRNNNVDYSGISDSTIRFVTFKYTQNRSNAPTVQIGIRFDYTDSGTTFPLLVNGLFGNGILFQYKVDSYKDSAGNTTSTANTTPSQSNQTTVWLNGNATLQDSFDTQSWQQPNFGALASNNGQDRYLTVRSGNYGFFDLYIRIGIPMNLNASFRRVFIFSYI